MVNRPHDVTDLYLAPVLLAVDARIGELGKLDKDGLVCIMSRAKTAGIPAEFPVVSVDQMRDGPQANGVMVMPAGRRCVVAWDRRVRWP